MNRIRFELTRVGDALVYRPKDFSSEEVRESGPRREGNPSGVDSACFVVSKDVINHEVCYVRRCQE